MTSPCQRVDAVVNAANRQLAGGGGVDGAIHRAAGAAALQAACRAIGECPPGRAVATEGFDLAARVDHPHRRARVAGWRARGGPDPGVVLPVLPSQWPTELGARSVAFPAISTGSLRLPRPGGSGRRGGHGAGKPRPRSGSSDSSRSTRPTWPTTRNCSDLQAFSGGRAARAAREGGPSRSARGGRCREVVDRGAARRSWR